MANPSTDLRHVYDDNVARVYAFFVYRTGSHEDAEDLTQATFERAVKAFDRYDPERASPATWLLAIATNLLTDHRRRAAVRPYDAADPAVIAAHAPHDDPFARQGLDPALSAALARLSDRDRAIVALRYGADLTGPEISEMTGLSVANVQQILSRSLRRLRDELDEHRLPLRNRRAVDSAAP